MAKRKRPPTATASGVQPQIFEATRGAGGVIAKGNVLTQTQAEARRKTGLDVVICGPDLSANRRLAGHIEISANGTAKRCPPHANAGAKALPHYQPDPRPPAGHTFYETPHRQAV